MDDTSIIHAFKLMKIPLMIVRPQGDIQQCNAAAEQLFGYSAGQMIGRPISDVLGVASVAELNAFITHPSIDTVIKGMIGRKRNGDVVALAIQLTAWTDPERGLHHALALRDITDEVDAASATKDELRRMNNAVRGARIGVFEYNPLSDTVIVSDIWRELLEIAPTDPVDVQIEWRGRVHPDDLDAALEPIRLCLDGVRERASCEYRLRARHGSQWRWMRTDVSIAQRDEIGSVVRLIGAMTDITEMKEVVESLRLRNNQFQSMFENAPIGKAIVALDGRWQWVNPALCNLLGYSEEELLKTDFQSVTHPDDVEADVERVGELLSGTASSYSLEKRYIRSNGATVWGLLSVALVRDENGQPLHFISQIVDVTEQRRISEIKSEFVATVSHELRTPLTSILASLELLALPTSERLTAQERRLISIARQNGEHLDHLVNNILDFEKFASGQQRLAISLEHVSDLLDKAVLANTAYAEKFGVRLVLENIDRQMMCHVDADRFQQIMANLISNASKFSAERQPIMIRSEHVQGDIRISVTNHGSDIPPEFGSHIFQPFALVSPSSTRTRGGAGLGLSICKHLVEQMGGQIGYVSEGGQTTFWYTVPAGNPVDASAEKEPQAERPGISLGGREGGC